MELLRRLAHARSLERLGRGAVTDAASAELSTPPSAEQHRGRVGLAAPFEWREVTLSLHHGLPSQGRSGRPALLGGCLEQLELPAESALARDLVCLGAARGGRAVFIDTETTGLGGVAVPFIVGIAWHEGASVHVGQWTLSRLGGEAEMLADVFAKLRTLGADPLVSFNGASFDLPLLRLRARRYGLCERILQLDHVDHVDLLYPSRRMQRGRSSDCRLSTLERDLLALHRRGDIDSAEIPAVFWDWLRAPEDPGAQRRLDAVRDHNLVDLVSLPALAAWLAREIRQPSDLDRARRSARHLLRLGAEDQARQLLSRWVDVRARGAPGAGRDPHWREAALELAALERRAGARGRAAALWQAAWREDPGCPAASEAWAKHLEHHVNDFAEALRVARGSRLASVQRLTRLERRLARSRETVARVGAEPEPDLEVEPARASDPKLTRELTPLSRRASSGTSAVPGSELLSVNEGESGAARRYRLLR